MAIWVLVYWLGEQIESIETQEEGEGKAEKKHWEETFSVLFSSSVDV